MRAGTRRLSLGLLFFAAIVIIAGVHTRCACAKPEALSGRYTEQEIREKSSRLLFSLYPQAERLLATAERRATLEIDNSRQTFWSVECFDDAGQYLGLISWDAETGSLLQVCRRDPASPWSSRPALMGEDVLQSVRKGLFTLYLDDMTAGLSATNRLKRTPCRWNVTWQSGAWTCMVRMNAFTGEMISFQRWRARSQTSLMSLSSRQ